MCCRWVKLPPLAIFYKSADKMEINKIHCMDCREGMKQIEDASIDVVMLGNILFQSSKKDVIIKEAKRILKEKGKLIIIDWKLNQPMGPPDSLVVSEKQIEEIAKKEGMVLSNKFPVDKYHWGMMFKK